MKNALLAHKDDNVANALDDVETGDTVCCSGNDTQYTFNALENIPFGFKIAVSPIEIGGEITKYGCAIGKASTAIRAGECVHIHNVEGTRGRGDKKGA